MLKVANSVINASRITGVLPVVNGGTGVTTSTGTTNVVLSNSPSLTTPTIAGATLSGTIAGGGNQINNVIIGTTSPLAGSFTTLGASDTTEATSTTAAALKTAGGLAVAKSVSIGGPSSYLSTAGLGRCFVIDQTTAAVNNSSVDALRFINASGTLIGTNFISGTVNVYVTGASGANGFAASYVILSTGNGAADASITNIAYIVRGTNPTVNVSIVDDGGGGAIKVQVNYINNGGVVTGGSSKVEFIGLIS